MNKSTILIVVLVIAVLLGGWGVYALVQNNSDETTENDVMGKEDDAMMEDDTMEKDDATHDDTMMEDDAMDKDDSMMEDDTMEKDGDAMDKEESSVGSYITYADYTSNQSQYDSGDVVLFFHAPWCPTCKALESNINANLSSIPAGTTIVKTDYDSMTDLKKQYGITYQHTFVQVDPDGNQIKKWSGSPTLDALVGEIS